MLDPFSSPWLYGLIVIIMVSRGFKIAALAFLSGAITYLLLYFSKIVFANYCVVSFYPSISVAMITSMVPWIIFGTPISGLKKGFLIICSIVLVSANRILYNGHTINEVIAGIIIGFVILIVVQRFFNRKKKNTSDGEASVWPNSIYVPSGLKNIWSRAEVAERYPGVMSPLFSDLFLPIIGRSINKMGNILQIKKKKTIIGYCLKNGLIYSNMSPNSLDIFNVLKFFLKIKRSYIDYCNNRYKNAKKEFWENHTQINKKLAKATTQQELYILLLESLQLFEKWMVEQSISLFYFTFTNIYLKLWLKLHFFSSLNELLTSLTKGIESPTYKEACILFELGKELNSINKDELNNSSNIKNLLKKYLDIAGDRLPNYDFTQKSWNEIPEQVLEFAKNSYQKNCPSPEELLKIHQKERKEAEELVVRKIKLFCPFSHKIVSEQFFQITRTINVFKEERQIQMSASWSLVKKILLKLSDSFVKSCYFTDDEDVFYLTASELAWLISDHSKTSPSVFIATIDDFKHLIKLRKNQYNNLNQSDIEINPEDRQNVLEFRVKSLLNLPDKKNIDKTLKGNYGLGKIVQGSVVIIKSQEEFTKMEPGKILVVPATNPNWDILFPNALGLITETGSPSSHPFLKANEYGLTAVLGVYKACKKLKDGDFVEINGREKTIKKLN